MRFLVLLVAFALPVFSQTFGEITGQVTDPTGAVIQGATVTVTNTATNVSRTVRTSEAGRYSVPFLVPGTYDIRVEQAGFRAATRPGLLLQVGDVARADFTLEVGAVTETVEVVAGAQQLQTESTAVGTVIENQRIIELPLNGRNYLQLVKLTPHVVGEMGVGGQADGRQGGERPQQGIAVAGQRLEFNHFTLDGIENTDVNFNTFVVRPSVEALQEFKVQSGVYSAEFGRATAQINVTTKPGTNMFHGALFEFHRNDDLDAKEWNKTGAKNPFVRNQFGFTLDGPVTVPKLFEGRDRLFFMVNYEGLRDRKATERRANVATKRMREGDFSQSGRNIYDPLSRVFDAGGRAISAVQFPGNIIPKSRFHPIALKLLEFYPEPTRPGDDTFQNFIRNASRPIDQDQLTTRIDWQESSGSSWFGRFSWGDEYQVLPQNFEQQEGKVVTRTKQAMLSNTRTFSPTVVNEFRFGYTQFLNDMLLHYAYERDVTAELGVRGLYSPVAAAWGTPSVSLEGAGISGFGESTEGPYVNRNHYFQWLDNLSIVKGRHHLRLGGEARRERYNQIGNQFARGSFIIQGRATFNPANRVGEPGHAFADYMLGHSRRSERALGMANTMFRRSTFAAYLEDIWRVTGKLTVNLGVRYELTPPFYDKYRGIMNVKFFDPGVGPNGLLEGTRVPIFVRPGKGDFYEGLLFRFHDAIPTATGDELLGRATVYTDKNDWAPRIGLAYTPTPRWSIRTGFGVFYTQDTGNPRFDMGRNLAGRGRYESNEEKPDSLFDDPWAAERALFQCTGWAGVCAGPPYTLTNATNRRTPYVFQWMFNIQRELPGQHLVELSYQGNAGHKLERMRAYNEAILRTGPSDTRTIEQRRPWPAYGRIQVVDGVVNSNYNALGIKVQKRLSAGLTYLAAFTWSKAIDGGSGVRTRSGDSLFPPNSYALSNERGLSQFDQRRRFVASILYDLPVGAGRVADLGRAGNALLGGWQVGTILTFGDGTPWNVGGMGDFANTGVDEFRPDATGISPFVDKPTPEKFWEINAFSRTDPTLPYRSPTAGRNVLRTPGTIMWDFALHKDFRVREGHKVEFRFEAFNFSNHPNWNTPPNDIRSPSTFGRVTSARTMRELQFGLKYLF